MNFKLTEKLLLALAVILALIAYYYGLLIDLTGDAGKYAAIARHITESNEWINLKIHGEAYDQKPPLLFWLSTFGFKLGGLHNWTYKIFPVLYGFTGFYFTFRLGKTLYDKVTGQLAALLLFLSEAFFLLSMDVHTDLILQANVTLAIWQLADYLKTGRNLNFIGAFSAIGLALMSKGPIGGAIPAFALGTHLLAKKDYKQLFHPKWLIGIVIAFLIATPAFIGLYNQFGLDGLKFFFITNNIGRITGEYAGHNTDLLFYFHTILYLTLPWTLFMLWAVFEDFKEIFKKFNTKTEFFTAGGIWIFFLIASIAKGKAPHYIFTLMPLFAIITAKWINTRLSENNRPKSTTLLILSRVTFIVLVMLLILLATYLFPPQAFIPTLTASIATIIAAVLLFKNQRLHTTNPLIPLVLTMAALQLYINMEVLPQAFHYQASTKATQLYNEEAKPDEPFYNYRYAQYELFFYSKTDAHRLYSLNALPPPSGKTWIFTDQVGKDSILAANQYKIEHIDTLSNRGMNRAGLQFILPTTRKHSLSEMYLIQLQAK